MVHLEELKTAGLPAPSVNQIELHPHRRREELVKYCLDNGIAPMGYSPLERGEFLKDPTLGEIAASYGRTPAQILIRWSVQKGFITIPKSVKPERILENANVFDFTLSEQDMQTLNSLPSSNRPDLTTLHWEG